MARNTHGIVQRIERNGFGVVRETASDKPGFFNNDTLIEGNLASIEPGSRVAMSVDDGDEVLVVRSITPL